MKTVIARSSTDIKRQTLKSSRPKQVLDDSRSAIIWRVRERERERERERARIHKATMCMSQPEILVAEMAARKCSLKFTETRLPVQFRAEIAHDVPLHTPDDWRAGRLPQNPPRGSKRSAAPFSSQLRNSRSTTDTRGTSSVESAVTK
jgi:hypothetical protein